MKELLGNGWPRRVPHSYFSNHTICQRCSRFFSTTDPADRCSETTTGYHTYTKKLHTIVERQYKHATGKKAPPLHLPGASAKRRNGTARIAPPEPLEKEWVMMEMEDESESELDKTKEHLLATPG